MATMDEYDLLIVADATYSMSSYLESLNSSLPQIISISTLTGCFSRIGLLAYRDYCDSDVIEWSGWLQLTGQDEAGSQPSLVRMAESLEPFGGGDYPEAVKTALAKAYSVMRSDAKTVIFLYTDAPPHTNDPYMADSKNPQLERDYLSQKNNVCGDVGRFFVDWVSGAKTLRSGEKQAQVFAVLESGMARHCAAYYNYLCTMTGGACVYLHNSRPETISKTTVELLLSWMGVEKPSAAGSADQMVPADLSRYIVIEGIKSIANEDDEKASKFFSYPYLKKPATTANIATIKLSQEVMKKFLPKKPVPALDPVKRWGTDPAYKKVAFEQLMRIIEDDIQAITINPVFGALWRAVCSDRTYSNRDALVNAFSQKVEQITNTEQKAKMKAWLEESYDNSAEVLGIIDSVPEEDRFPCVFLDPTLDFSQADAGSDDDDNQALADLTRADLLEIGRSCDPRVLRRLGRVLTRLSYVRTADEMPAHIAQTDGDKVTRIPVSLATQKYGRRFWKILLHVIVPGTLLTGRAAALLAALTLRLGVAPLARAAEREMLSYKNKWNDAEIPETWAVSCLTLLLNADDTYRQSLESSGARSEQDEREKKPTSLLNEKDRTLFEQLVAFKTLEFNLDTPLTARVPWTPEKSVSSIGPLVVCKKCHFPRSVTIMGRGGKCGICLATDFETPEEYARVVGLRVSKEDTSSSMAAWVECNVPSCRGQYVVYDVDGLLCRAKCHYCRTLGSQAKGKPELAPTVECKQCHNRMIWPAAYRPAPFNESEFVCPPCTSGREAATDVEMTAKKLAVENVMSSWLVCDTGNPEKEPFTNRSPFHIVSAMGTKGFMDRIKLFPPRQAPLTQRGKPIQNTDTLISTLQDLVAGRKTEKVYCSLCFSTFWPSGLSPACGRRGCQQRICTDCLKGWYGSNSAGRIVNPAALSCPFCRRMPTTRTLAKNGSGVHAVRDLTLALENRGSWTYAWCSECFTAKEFVERSCARGAPPEVTDWKCTECVETLRLERLEEERRAVEQALEEARVAENEQRQQELEARQRAIEEARNKAKMASIKPCPGCKVLSQRVSGCGHIRCPYCAVHWCYFCGKEFKLDEIYRHMNKKHGGIYGEDWVDSEYEGDHRWH